MTSRLIPLTQGRFAIVDADDYDWLNQHKWHAVKSQWGGYYAAYRGKAMHRIIMNAPCGIEVDHCDLNGLNNSRANLRLATHGQNSYNRGPQSNNKAGIKGVRQVKRTGQWEARIAIDGETRSLGQFQNKEIAATAYMEAAKRLHGQFFRLTGRENNVSQHEITAP